MKDMNSEPDGFYQLWLKSLRDGQEQMLKAGAQGILDSQQAWKQWLEATMATWYKFPEMGPDPLGLTTQWLRMMESVREKMLNGEIVAADPFTFFKEWYDAISESWSKVVEETIASEQFLEFNRLFLQSYTSFSKAFHRANEEYLRVLQIPSRADISHVAELVVALEDKVDRQDDRFDDIENAFSQTAKSEAIAGLGKRLDAVESKLDELHGNLVRPQTIEGLAQRLEQVESKLDTILVELAKIEKHAVNGHDEPNAEVPQKPQKKKASQSVVKSEESDSGA